MKIPLNHAARKVSAPYLDYDQHHKDALGRLRRAIIENTQGDMFWIGEALLFELEKETGFIQR